MTSASLMTTPAELDEYNAWVRGNPRGSLWQSVAWKEYQETLNREVRIYVCRKNQESRIKNQVGSRRINLPATDIIASALVVIDRTIGGFSTWDIARGPLFGDTPVQVLIDRILADAKQERALCVYMSPAEGKISGYAMRTSARCEQLPATRIIDLTPPLGTTLGQMHPKGRYNIKVAERRGVSVRKGTNNDLEAVYEILKQTGKRDGFKISQKSHYSRFLTDLRDSFMLIAEKDGKTIAGLFGVIWNNCGIYYYGASSYADRQLMAPYLLQWETMRYCKTKGCTKYDLLGIGPEKEVGSSTQEHLWAGITDFKRKFGGTVVNFPPEKMIVLKPIIYKALLLKRKIFG